ncbi:hypothetical protein [Sutcliffiella horikoshii]|uniref:hypothetical protein n=1 Tax=Sutcliffiella horikoshii TaxID=79883 RepID=UPI001F2C2FB0|nr:hypothetical protein [Sutcliffiella horikoshii]MCG1022814.1 hypothetical protein [Sutcliffiella horikoshii]
MVNITLLHAELINHSYNLCKLEGYVRMHSTIDNEQLMINYSIGGNDRSIPYTKVMVMDNFEVVKFVDFIVKQSGLVSEGFSFRLSFPSSYMTDAYYIGGRHGEIIMENTKIKHHQLYLHHDNLTGTVIIKSSLSNKKVRFVCFNESHSITAEAIFRECIPYSENEVWEYSLVLTEDNLSHDWSFYVELLESNASSRDDNFIRYYKLWEQVPRPM